MLRSELDLLGWDAFRADRLPIDSWPIRVDLESGTQGGAVDAGSILCGPANAAGAGMAQGGAIYAGDWRHSAGCRDVYRAVCFICADAKAVASKAGVGRQAGNGVQRIGFRHAGADR